MSTPPQARPGIPVDVFIAEYDRAPFEWVNGRRIPLIPRVAGQTVIISNLLEIAYRYTSANPDKGDFYPSVTYVSLDEAGNVTRALEPGTAFYAAARWDEYVANTPDWGDKPLALVPDLCVEVLCKNDLFGDVQRKAALYLEDGVREVWVVSPDAQSLLVYTAGLKTIARLTAGDSLTSPLLPDLALPVASLFPA